MVSIISIAISGCAIHPLPQDVAVLNTNAVVNRIRCETRDAIATAIGQYLASQSDAASRSVGAELLSGGDFSLPHLASVDKEARANVIKYIPAAVAFDFTFDMTEDNDVGTQIDFMRTFSRGVFSMPLKAENDRMRQTVRNFRISDTFGGLLAPTPYCAGSYPENQLYPITGKIGMLEMIKTFVDLNEFQHLTGSKDDKAKVPILADTFNFQTTISGSLAPKVTLAPVRGLADASLTVAGSRKDIHKVIVALSLSPSKNVALAAASAQLVGPAFRLNTLAFDKTPAEQLAVSEIYNQVERNILNGIAQNIQ